MNILQELRISCLANFKAAKGQEQELEPLEQEPLEEPQEPQELQQEPAWSACC